MVRETTSSIHFFFEKVNLGIRDRKKLKKFIAHLFQKEGKQLSSISYIFCTDEALLKINRLYLKHDFYTDVISFDLSDSPDKIIAEVYISIDRLKENAKTFKSSVTRELHRIIFHGALHLCGYNDKGTLQKGKMRKKEDFYLDLYFTRFT